MSNLSYVLASLVPQNAIHNGFFSFFSSEKNFPYFSRKLKWKKAISVHRNGGKIAQLCKYILFKDCNPILSMTVLKK